MYFKQIDTFRFFAAFLVLIAHWFPEYPILEKMMLGRIGVEFFFVISGFLISRQLFQFKEAVENKTLNVGNAYKLFFFRRALRIFPLYYTVLFLTTLLNKGQLREAFWWNLSYTSNFYFIKIQTWTRTFSHFWSLSVEEHFYLLWPLLFFILIRKYLPKGMIVIALLALIFRYYSWTNYQDYFVAYTHTLSCLDLFMFGAMLSYLLLKKEKWFYSFFSSTKNQIITFITFGLILTFTTIAEGQDLFKVVFLRSIFGIYFALIVGFLVVGVKGPIGKIFENKWLIFGGKLSYAIYLIHNFVPGILLGLKKFGWPDPILGIVYLLFTMLLSVILYYSIEIPMRKLNRFFPLPYRKT